jgi:hypothetical protein
MPPFQPRKHQVKVPPSLFQRQPAKPVIPAEFYDHDLRPKPQNHRQTRNSILGCGSTGTLVYDLVVISLRIQLPLQSIRKGLAFRQSVTGGDTVAEAHKDVWPSRQQRGGKHHQEN